MDFNFFAKKQNKIQVNSHFKKFPKNKLLSALIVIMMSSAMIACSKKDSSTIGNAPSISFMSLQGGNSLQVGSNQYINIVFSFSDPKGLLGNSPASGNYDIYTEDDRDTSVIAYYFPKGLRDLLVKGQSVSGTCSLAIEGAYQQLRPNRASGDTLRLKLYILNSQGVKSNMIQIPDIYLTP